MTPSRIDTAVHSIVAPLRARITELEEELALTRAECVAAKTAARQLREQIERSER